MKEIRFPREWADLMAAATWGSRGALFRTAAMSSGEYPAAWSSSIIRSWRGRMGITALRCDIKYPKRNNKKEP